MPRLLFQSRWAALTFVVISALAIAAFIGDERAAHNKAEAQAQAIASKTAEAVPEPGKAEAKPEAAGDDVIWGYASDEDLMVDPSGFDPSPDVPTTPDNNLDQGEPQQADAVGNEGGTMPAANRALEADGQQGQQF